MQSECNLNAMNFNHSYHHKISLINYIEVAYVGYTYKGLLFYLWILRSNIWLAHKIVGKI